MKNIFIGGAWPYANNSLHIGHLAALLPGDVLARFFRKNGDNVLYVSGSDCHGTPITVRANKLGVSGQEIAGYYDNEFRQNFQDLEFSYDLYTNTMTEYHANVVKENLKKIADKGYFYTKTEKEDYKQANREDRLVDLYSKQHILSRAKNSCILFDEAEDVMNRGFSCFGSASKGYLNKILENASVPVIWTTNNIYDVDPAFLRRMTYAVEFEKLSEENRLDIWKKVLKKNNLKVKKSKLEELNKSYDIPPSLIANAVQSTKMIDGDEDDFEDFIENVARVVTKKKNIKTKKEFEVKNYDINLINTDTDMDDLTQKIKKSGKLNFSLCLYGEPGSGKSLYARYLANVLGIEVVFKRASDLISKWVGETEQNIASAFAEAKAKKAMLIFDEADSFLQNRNNAQRSFEVTQVNEMLTWMESHEYPFVCTTNLFDSLDEASLRRFTFKVRYVF